MRYMFLVYSREGAFAEAPAEDRQNLVAGHWTVLDETRKKGVLVAADPLQPTATATTVRNEGGKPLVLDGPFAETKEQLAGYYIIGCKNLDEAIERANKDPDVVQRRRRLHRDPPDCGHSAAIGADAAAADAAAG